jgi:hypothetical protein
MMFAGDTANDNIRYFEGFYDGCLRSVNTILESNQIYVPDGDREVFCYYQALLAEKDGMHVSEKYVEGVTP